MKIEDHLSDLNKKSQLIFDKSIEFRNELGKAHHYSSCLHEFSEKITENSEREILKTVSSQLESATLNACQGMYRQAFSSLRLALEMGLAAAHFSVHKLELHEWLGGRYDIKWSCIIDENNGVLSNRFADAFFPEFKNDIVSYRKKSSEIYRQLSEFVHGNNETWENSGIELVYNESRLKSYFKSINTVSEIILFVLSCRYLKSFPQEALESLEFIPEEMNHLSYVREYFGGPKG